MRLIPALALLIALAAPAAAKPPLSQVRAIDDALMAIAIADEIRKTCDGINARMIRAMSRINSLRAEAKALGYTNDEIDAYTSSKAEKKRMRSKAEAYLASQGVDARDEAALCRFGRDEIARNTAIGSLLR
ncbi:DUF5333 domain-containing protein [Pseudoponticoccus marisrubri]|uniref:NADH dehydrogenase n=1 Tax=Pseudoponticoccus marisrubri TaxID=1685382 RepID=A0A0W7WET1_9RHOB|nr:DUF5333 domain-containing protein [Pseudoponticoccus marisrubri]KUF09081.1 hypothetical protein AVJ23_19335 [Pseudoponticoccus marisrubri]